jgi:hypothetical protein
LFLTTFRYGQLSALTLCLFALALAAFRSNRPFAAGLAIGTLAYKPQLGVVAAVVLLASREWRVVAGAAAAVAGQLIAGWAVGGSELMREYFGVLRTLALNPGLVQLYPSEVHSVRGFFQLLLPWPPAVTLCFLAALIAILALAVRSWQTSAAVDLKWAQVVLLTVLASPHLLAYDLLLLSIPLMLLADHIVRHPHSREAPLIVLLLVALYLSPFSGNLARVIFVQLSVIVMGVLAIVLYRELARTTVDDGRVAT